MPRKRFRTEQIVTKLRQAEVELGRGLRTPQICKKLGVSEQTYYRWRKEYGGLRFDQAKRLKALEQDRTLRRLLIAGFCHTGLPGDYRSKARIETAGGSERRSFEG